MAAGTRKYQSSAQCTVKLVTLVSEEMDQRVRSLAARRGVGVATLVREWITEKVRPSRHGRDNPISKPATSR
jgi:hypothetical protein